MPSSHRPQSSSQTLAMDTTNVVLTTLRDAARIAPIPYLQGAAGTALGILDIIQGAQNNREAFQRLADDACGLVYAAILCTNRIGTTGVSEELLDNLRELQGTLHVVESFAKKRASRRKVFRLIAYKSDLGAIQEHRDRMKQSLDLFGLKSSITIQRSITHIAVQQEELVNALREQKIQQNARLSTDTETLKGKPKGLDSFLKAEDQDSWGKGTNGSTSQEVSLMLLDGIPAHRSIHQCNGGMFDEKFLDGYVREDPTDMTTKTKVIFQAEQARNEADGVTLVAATETFFRMVKGLKCNKETCSGEAVLKLLKNPPSTDGKSHFIGCSDWCRAEEWEHIYAPIPSMVDETILAQLMNNQPVNSPDVDNYKGGCSTFIHPRHGKQGLYTTAFVVTR